MVGGSCNVGCNLKRGLEKLGHRVVLVKELSVFDDYSPDKTLWWGGVLRKNLGRFDVVHIHSPNLKKFLFALRYLLAGSVLVCHWHGSDLRLWRKSFPVRHLCFMFGVAHLYSTRDLAWWIWTDKSCKFHVWCPVDTEVFRPYLNRKSGIVLFDGGGKSYQEHRVLHRDMPSYLNRFAVADIRNAMGLDDGLMSVIALEAASCGLVVKQFPWMDRDWVVDHASIGVVSERVESIYKGLIS